MLLSCVHPPRLTPLLPSPSNYTPHRTQATTPGSPGPPPLSTMDIASTNTTHHAVATAPTMASTAPPPPPPPVATPPPPSVSSLPPNIISAAHVEHHPNLFTHAPSLSSSFSSLTTGSASSLATANTGRSSSSSSSSNGMSEEDRRLHNMPKPLASKCVEAFIAWGNDHKGNPATYQKFLRLNLPHYPGVDAEKVRLYMKNICATYHERYIPARARGYNQDFQAWWEKRPGRGRPKKDVTVPSAYALAHHLDPSLAPTRGRGGGFRQSESGAGGRLATNKPRRRRTPTKRAKAVKATASAARGGSSGNVVRRKSGGGGGGGGGHGNYTDEDSDGDNEVYYYGSDFGEIEEEEDVDDDEMNGDNYHRGQQKKEDAVRGFSKSGRAIRRPSDPYLNAVQEEATKRARIEAALAMMEMDDNNGRATGCGPPSSGIRTPFPPLFSTYHGASIYPVRHHGRNALRIESPVPLTDQDVTNILTDLRSNSFASSNKSNGGGGGSGAEANSNSNNKHIGANNTIANEDSKMPAPAAAAAMATPCATSPRSRPPIAPRAIRTGGNPASAHAPPPPCAQALAGLVNLGGAHNLGRATSPSSRLVEVNPPMHARPHYVVHPHPHPHAAAGQMYMNSAPASAAAAAPHSASPMQFLLGSGGPPPQHPGKRHHVQEHAYPHAQSHAAMHGTAHPPAFHQYVYQPQPRNCQDPQCTGCPATTFLNPPAYPPSHPHHYQGGGGESAAHRRH